jgi:zinc transporter ZupT
MTNLSLNASEPQDGELERVFIERERNRFAGRALSYLVLLNGAAALVLLTIMAQAPESTMDRKLAAAMMFFSGGAVAALLSSFLAYVNRTVRMESPGRANFRRVLRWLAIAAVIGSGAAFVIGMNMVGTTSAEKSSSHPKGPRQDKRPASAPSEKVKRLDGASRRASVVVQENVRS